MKPLHPKHNWIVDAVLFFGFILAFWMDLTGLDVHQWLGVLIGLFIGYHALVHWNWVKCTLSMLLRRWCRKPMTYMILDTILAFGFLTILVTGLVMSTWFKLNLPAYETWRVVHILSSIWTLVLLVVKLVLHWDWIEAVARRYIFPAPQRETVPTVDFARREFLGILGVVGVSAGLAMLSANKALMRGVSSAAAFDTGATQTAKTEPAQAASTPAAAQATPTTASPAARATATPVAPTPVAPSPSTPAPTPTPTPLPTATATCVVRCPRGCSYPGRCRRYTDRNNNGRCDLGECL